MSFVEIDIQTLLASLIRKSRTLDLEGLLRDKINALANECFKTNAFGQVTIQNYFLNVGRLYFFTTVDHGENSTEEQIRELITHIKSFFYITQNASGTFTIYTVCKELGSAPMHHLLQYALGRWNELVPLELEVDIANLSFSKAFNLYVMNRFVYARFENNRMVILRFVPPGNNTVVDSNGITIQYQPTKLAVTQYRTNLLESLLGTLKKSSREHRRIIELLSEEQQPASASREAVLVARPAVSVAAVAGEAGVAIPAAAAADGPVQRLHELLGTEPAGTKRIFKLVFTCRKFCSICGQYKDIGEGIWDSIYEDVDICQDCIYEIGVLRLVESEQKDREVPPARCTLCKATERVYYRSDFGIICCTLCYLQLYQHTHYVNSDRHGMIPGDNDTLYCGVGTCNNNDKQQCSACRSFKEKEMVSVPQHNTCTRCKRQRECIGCRHCPFTLCLECKASVDELRPDPITTEIVFGVFAHGDEGNGFYTNLNGNLFKKVKMLFGVPPGITAYAPYNFSILDQKDNEIATILEAQTADGTPLVDSAAIGMMLTLTKSFYHLRTSASTFSILSDIGSICRTSFERTKLENPRYKNMLAGRFAYPVYNRLWIFTPRASPFITDPNSKYYGLYVMRIKNVEGTSHPMTNLLRNVSDAMDTRPAILRERSDIPTSHVRLIDALSAVCRGRLHLCTTTNTQTLPEGKKDSVNLVDVLHAFEPLLEDYKSVSIVDLVCRSRNIGVEHVDPLMHTLRNRSTTLFRTDLPPPFRREASDTQEEYGGSRELQELVYYGSVRVFDESVPRPVLIIKSCQTCTFDNPISARKCEMCGIPLAQVAERTPSPPRAAIAAASSPRAVRHAPSTSGAAVVHATPISSPALMPRTRPLPAPPLPAPPLPAPPLPAPPEEPTMPRIRKIKCMHCNNVAKNHCTKCRNAYLCNKCFIHIHRNGNHDNVFEPYDDYNDYNDEPYYENMGIKTRIKRSYKKKDNKKKTRQQKKSRTNKIRKTRKTKQK